MKKQSVNFLTDEKSYLCTVEQIKKKNSGKDSGNTFNEAVFRYKGKTS